MTDFTKQDAIIEASNETKPIRGKQAKSVKNLFQNVGTIVTISIVVLSMILFSYNMGYCSVFSLPPSVLSIDIKNFLPFAVQMIGIMIYIFLYLSSILADRITNSNSFDITRVIIGITICLWLMIQNKMVYALGVWGLLISFCIPIVLELIKKLIVIINNKPIKNPTIDKERYEFEKKEYISRTLFPHYSVRLVVSVIAVIVCLSSAFGMISATTKREYQLVKNENGIYAVIDDNSDNLIVQEATIISDSLEINTNNYSYFPKENQELFRVVFKHVTINKHDNNQILKDIQATKDQV